MKRGIISNFLAILFLGLFSISFASASHTLILSDSQTEYVFDTPGMHYLNIPNTFSIEWPEFQIDVWGAGGGGGGYVYGAPGGRYGLGGGGGAFGNTYDSIQKGSSITIEVGKGGKGGDTESSGEFLTYEKLKGDKGGDSKVSYDSSPTLVAQGGTGGYTVDNTNDKNTQEVGKGGSASELFLSRYKGGDGGIPDFNPNSNSGPGQGGGGAGAGGDGGNGVNNANSCLDYIDNGGASLQGYGAGASGGKPIGCKSIPYNFKYQPGGGGEGGTFGNIGGFGGDGKVIIKYISNNVVTPNPQPNPNPSCTDEQTILKISANTNAQGELYNGANNYPIEICYNDLFPSSSIPSNPHSCKSDGSNRVLRLSASTNAQAEDPALNNYQTPVCYGDLQCTLRNNACQAEETSVVSLSSNTNAQLALGTDINYAKKICCKIQTITPPETTEGIIAPEHRQIYFANTNLDFEYRISDVNSKIEWTIEKDNTIEFTSQEKKFTKLFSSSGQRTITIKVTKQEEIPKEYQIAILIINSPGLFTFIEKPKHKQYILSDNLEIDYGTEESYIITSQQNDNGCSGRTLTCVAGNCPDKVKNSPPGCSNNVPVGGGKKEFTNSNFKWKFPMKGIGGTIIESISEGSGNSFSKGKQGYAQIGDYRIDLLFKYTEDNTLQNLFQREFYLRRGSCSGNECVACSEDGQWLIVLNKETMLEKQRYETSNSLLGNTPACAGIDRLAGTRDDCCPSNSECKLAESGKSAGCYISNIKSCSEYNTQSLCEQGNAWQIDSTKDIPNTNGALCGDSWAVGQCAYNLLCNKCSWDNTQRKCYLEKEERPSNDNPSTCSLDNQKTICKYHIKSETICQDGFKIIDIETIKEGPDTTNSCQNRKVTLPCGRAVLELPFFTSLNIIITLLGIIIVYFFMYKHQNQKHL